MAIVPNSDSDDYDHGIVFSICYVHMFCYENNALHENTGVAHNGVESIDVKGHEVPTSINSSFPTQNAICWKIAPFCI